jgi:hypothetical protein
MCGHLVHFGSNIPLARNSRAFIQSPFLSERATEFAKELNPKAIKRDFVGFERQTKFWNPQNLNFQLDIILQNLSCRRN